MKKRLIQVFEHATLRYPNVYEGVEFTEDNFNALVRWNERHQNGYFTVVHKGIRFSHYVGVIRVGNLTIEILPKADKSVASEASRAQWQSFLLDMLAVCNRLKTKSSGSASLQSKPGSLLDIYLQSFLDELETILRQGLIKRYRQTESNSTTLKGSLHFTGHLRENLIHQERFYTRHPTYDSQHLIHQILYKALRSIPRLTDTMSLLDQTQALLLRFPALDNLDVTPTTFKAIRFDRSTQPYETALEIARLLLLQYRPDIRTGHHSVLAILFDMNALFEEYIYCQLKQAGNEQILIQRQQPSPFWEGRKVRPDIVIRQLEEGTNYIVDTKWKVLERLHPDDDDLKQMFVYNQHFCSAKSVLLYPEVHRLGTAQGWFHQANPSLSNDPEKQAHSCEIRFVQVVENGQLNRSIGQTLLREIMGK